MIELKHVSKRFTGANEVEAVRDANITIADGEIFGIIGFSGAGKSTLVRCINLLERPTSGQVIIHGQDLTSLKEKQLRLARRKIGMIFQHFNLMKSRTVFSNVAYPLRGSGLSSQARKEKVTRLLQLVGLEEKATAYPSQLSGGQKQRVAIARALANDPGVLLCDEATSALDPQTTQDILRLLRQLNQDLGITIVLITHEMAVVKEICSRVAVMEKGVVVEQGDIYSLFSNPQHPVTQNFISTTENMDKLDDMLAGDPASLGIRQGDIVAKLEFTGESAGEALVSQLSREYSIDISIIFGNVEMLAGKPLGKLVVILRGDAQMLQSALNCIRENNVRLEVLRNV